MLPVFAKQPHIVFYVIFCLINQQKVRKVPLTHRQHRYQKLQKVRFFRRSDISG